MTKHSVLIISSPLDLHARAVSWTLKRYGCSVSYYDTSDSGTQGDGWSFELGDGRGTLRTGTEVPNFDSVWDRRRFPKNSNEQVHTTDREFVAKESRYFDIAALNLLNAQPQIRWVDPPAVIYRSENKLEQLVAAQTVGLAVPRTLVSRNYRQVLAFVEHLGSFVIKPFSGYMWYENDTPRFEAIANCVDDASLLSEPSVSVCPSIYQESIDKVSDIRVVVIGEKVYATRYSVKSGFSANFDCRVNIRSQEATVAEPIELDQATRSSLLALLAHFGLTYASSDFAEAADGSLYFLDLNPQGQFLFNEHFTPHYRLLDAMSRHIVGTTLSSATPAVALSDYVASEDHSLFLRESVVACGNIDQPRGSYSEEVTSEVDSSVS